MPRRMFVNVYERDRHFGGPEEGGWWWDSFEAKSTRRCASEKQARQWQAKIEASFTEPHYGVYSVLYAGGSFVCWVEEHPAKNQPEERPRYE